MKRQKYFLTISFRKHAHAIHINHFALICVYIFFLFCSKHRLCVYVRTALAIIHNLCFGSNMRKYGLPLQTLVYYIKVGNQGVFTSRTCFPDVSFDHCLLLPSCVCVVVLIKPFRYFNHIVYKGDENAFLLTFRFLNQLRLLHCLPLRKLSHVINRFILSLINRFFLSCEN